MNNRKFFDDIAARLSELVANSPAKDLEKNARALLAGMFSRLDLVTREEFEVQRELLARTREKVDVLEQRLAALEAHLGRDEPSR